MPYESEFDVKIGYIDEKGFHEIRFDDDSEIEPEEMIAKSFYRRYEAFLKVGFDQKQAFALTRDWFDSTLEEHKNEHD